jgi:sugar lactone lactonase YvrE
VKDRQASLHASGFKFLEAPKWRSGSLWVADVFDYAVIRIDSDGSGHRVCAVPQRPSSHGFMPDGRHIVVSAKDQKLMEIVDGELREFVDLSPYAQGCINDFAVDAVGRIYVGDFGYDYDGGEPLRPTSLYRIDPDGAVRTAATDIIFPNGSAFVDGGKTLIVAETWASRITAFDVASDGELSNRRVFADLGHRQPDGLCADSEGAIWVGCFNTGEFLRVLDGGAITDRFTFDGSAICCTLGGDDGRTLFMTAFLGPVDEIATEARKSVVFKATVEVPGARPAARN